MQHSCSQAWLLNVAKRRIFNIKSSSNVIFKIVHKPQRCESTQAVSTQNLFKNEKSKNSVTELLKLMTKPEDKNNILPSKLRNRSPDHPKVSVATKEISLGLLFSGIGSENKSSEQKPSPSNDSQKPKTTSSPFSEFNKLNNKNENNNNNDNNNNNNDNSNASQINPYLKQNPAKQFSLIADALKNAQAPAPASAAPEKKIYESLADLFTSTLLKQRVPGMNSKGGVSTNSSQLFGSIAERSSKLKRTIIKSPSAQITERRPPRKVLIKASKPVHIPSSVNAKGLASLLGVRAVDVLKRMILLGESPEKSEDIINFDLAEIIAQDLGFTTIKVNKDVVIDNLKKKSITNDSAIPKRSPIVVIMGHINHGKTTLLDSFRNSKIADSEHGKITQRLGAFQANLTSGNFTFLDTPGHAAFNTLRKRGAKVADLCILVVAADEGVKEQTIEAIKSLNESKLPFIVAINKCDKGNADPQRVKTELMNHGVIVEEFGGNVLTVNISASKRTSLEDLEQAMLIVADQLNLRADPNLPGGGYVIESKLDKRNGPVATCLVHFGSIKPGDYVVAGTAWGKVRTILDDEGKQMGTAGPSSAVQIVGFKDVPEPGEDLTVAESANQASQVAERNLLRKSQATKVDFTKAIQIPEEQKVKEITFVIKGDTIGSVEAISAGLQNFPQDEVKARILKSGVGDISETDIQTAATSGGCIIAFGVKIQPKTLVEMQKQRVPVFQSNIIYDIIDKAEAHLSSFLEPIRTSNVLGVAVVQAVFDITVGRNLKNRIAGCKIAIGSVRRNSQIRVVRDDKIIHQGKVESLKHFKDDISEAKLNTECGLGVENFQDIQVGDKIEAFEIQVKYRKLGEKLPKT